MSLRAPTLWLTSLLWLSLLSAAAAEPERIDILYDRSIAYEQQGDLPAALASAEKILSQSEESCDIRLRLAWLRMKMGDSKAALEDYRRAAAISPGSEDAWLGMQWAAVTLERFDIAVEAGDRLLKLNGDNYFGLLRQAYARFMQGDLGRAETLYRKALGVDPQSGEALLGLGFTLIRQGRLREGRDACERARAFVQKDPRVLRCLEEAAGKRPFFAASVYGGYLYYTNPWNYRDLKSLTVSLAVIWQAGFTLWAGANLSETVLNYSKEDYRQANPAIGLTYRHNGLTVKGAASWLLSSSASVDNSPVAVLGIGYDGVVVGGGVDVSGSFYSPMNVFEAKPGLRFFVGEKLRISLWPDLIFVTGDGAQGSGHRRDPLDVLPSGHLQLTYIPVEIASVYLSGYYGERRYGVDADGLSIWSNDDLFVGGYAIGAIVRMHRYVSLNAEFRQDFAKKQEGLAHEFSVLGGILGLLFHYNGR